MTHVADDRPKLNDKLIDCVLEHIEHEVKKDTGAYNQNTWATIAIKGKRTIKCNSVGCFAGWACMLSTPTKEWYDTFNLEQDADGDAYEWAGEAAKKLGLTSVEAGYLFGGVESNHRAVQLDKIKERVANIRKARKLGVGVYSVL